MNEPHEPSDKCLGVHCFTHNVDEPADETVYRVCGECGHVYRTRWELLRAYRTMRWRSHLNSKRWTVPPFKEPGAIAVLWGMVAARADKIYFCQHCIHDF